MRIEEDWERISELDKLWLMEKEQEMWNEYQQWDDEQSRLPAKIKLLSKPRKHENKRNSVSFPRVNTQRI